MTGYQAAMGRVQVAKIDRILAEKRRVAAAYTRLLAEVPGITTPVEQPWAEHVYWMYGILVEDEFGLHARRGRSGARANAASRRGRSSAR